MRTSVVSRFALVTGWRFSMPPPIATSASGSIPIVMILHAEIPSSIWHLAFGTGKHICLGNHLAKLEMTSILEAMLDQVETFSVGTAQFALNNLLRTLKSMPIHLRTAH